MRVIIKHPGAAPTIADIAGSYESLRAALGADPGSCITYPGVRVWCDDDALLKTPLPKLNLIRPSDAAPVHGIVAVLGEEGPDCCGLDDRQVALWMATLSLIGVDELATWRAAALDQLVPLVHDQDRAMFEQLRKLVAYRHPDLGAPWPRGMK